MDPSSLPPLLPQIITAVASLGGVLIGLLVNGRRESGRFAKQIEFERQKILADDRRKLFIRTAHAMQRMRERLVERAWAEEVGASGDWEAGVTERANELFTLETEIRLLAPTLTNDVRTATQTARLIRDAPAGTPQTEVERLRAEFLKYTMTAMTHMRSVLGTEPADPFAQHRQRK